jgi:hypothetical protein
MLSVKLARSYRSKNGNATFVYEVSGSTQDIEAFKTAQGDYYRVADNGKPLWFTTRCIGPAGHLVITTNGNVVPDMSKFDQASSLASQYGGNFGEELARMSAQAILGGNAPQADSAPAKEDEPAKAEGSSDDEIGDL